MVMDFNLTRLGSVERYERGTRFEKSRFTYLHHRRSVILSVRLAKLSLMR